MEFRSVVDAVRCAIEIQNGLIERNAGVPPDRRIEFRVGIHLGDVVEESDGDLMGDGVNRVPLPSMVDECREGADGLSVASGAYGFVWDWECREGKPVIVGPAKVWGGKSTEFDGQGYAEQEWHALTEARQ